MSQTCAQIRGLFCKNINRSITLICWKREPLIFYFILKINFLKWEKNWFWNKGVQNINWSTTLIRRKREPFLLYSAKKISLQDKAINGNLSMARCVGTHPYVSNRCWKSQITCIFSNCSLSLTICKKYALLSTAMGYVLSHAFNFSEEIIKQSWILK